MRIYKIEIDPVSKPRQTRSDKWKKRDCVVRYRAFADELRLLVKKAGFKPTDSIEVDFFIALPESWSEKKKNSFVGQPHQSKPDIDNLLKAIMDILYETDQHVWKLKAAKFWSDLDEGYILFKQN